MTGDVTVEEEGQEDFRVSAVCGPLQVYLGGVNAYIGNISV